MHLKKHLFSIILLSLVNVIFFPQLLLAEQSKKIRTAKNLIIGPFVRLHGYKGKIINKIGIDMDRIGIEQDMSVDADKWINFHFGLTGMSMPSDSKDVYDKEKDYNVKKDGTFKTKGKTILSFSRNKRIYNKYYIYFKKGDKNSPFFMSGSIFKGKKNYTFTLDAIARGFRIRQSLAEKIQKTVEHYGLDNVSYRFSYFAEFSPNKDDLDTIAYGTITTNLSDLLNEELYFFSFFLGGATHLIVDPEQGLNEKEIPGLCVLLPDTQEEIIEKIYFTCLIKHDAAQRPFFSYDITRKATSDTFFTSHVVDITEESIGLKDPQKLDINANVLLDYAYETRNINLIKQYASDGHDIDLFDVSEKYTYLFRSVQHNDKEMVTLFLNLGADPNKNNYLEEAMFQLGYCEKFQEQKIEDAKEIINLLKSAGARDKQE